MQKYSLIYSSLVNTIKILKMVIQFFLIFMRHITFIIRNIHKIKFIMFFQVVWFHCQSGILSVCHVPLGFVILRNQGAEHGRMHLCSQPRGKPRQEDSFSPGV